MFYGIMSAIITAIEHLSVRPEGGLRALNERKGPSARDAGVGKRMEHTLKELVKGEHILIRPKVIGKRMKGKRI